MYKTIKGIYKKGQIVLTEPVAFNQDEIEVIITFLQEEKKTEMESLSSADKLLYSMGERAIEGKLSNASEKHDQYLYCQGTK